MKKAIVFLGAFVLALAANASYLYWQVDDSYLSANGGVKAEAFQVWAVNGGSWNLVDTAAANTDGLMVGPQVSTVDVSSYQNDSYVFYIELVNYDTATQTFTNTGFMTESYSSMASANTGFVGSALNIGQVAVWHGGAYAAPEPTSAMMILLGLAGLALKRKQV